MTINIALWGLGVGIALLLLDKFIKKYPFSYDNIFTYPHVLIRLVWGGFIVSTLSVFISVTFYPENMENCYSFCGEYYEYIFIGSMVALLVEIVPLILHYLNVDIGRQIRKFNEQT